jgi:type I restriction enzyme, S subunit
MIEAWETKPLNQIISLQRGFDLPTQSRDKGDIAVIGSNGTVGFHSSAPNNVPIPGLMVGRSGSVGRITYWDKKYWPLNTVLYVKDFHGNDPYFLSFWLQLFPFKQYAEGVSVPTLNRNSIGDVLFPIPKPEDQEKITPALDKVITSVNLHTEAIEKSQELKHSAMRELFTRGLHGEAQKETEIGLVPESWKIVQVEDIFDNLDGMRIPVRQSDRKAGIYPYYGASGIADYVDSYLFDGDYLLVAEDGENLATKKLPIAFIASGKFWVNNHAHVLKNKKGSNIIFYEKFISSMDIQDYLTGTTRPKLNKGLLMSMLLPLPSEEEQNEIAEILDAIDRKIDLHKRKKAVLEELFQSLLHKLMTGEIRVADLDLSAIQKTEAA